MRTLYGVRVIATVLFAVVVGAVTQTVAAGEVGDPVVVAEEAVTQWASAATEPPDRPGVFAAGGPQWSQISSDLAAGVGSSGVVASTGGVGVLSRDNGQVLVGWVGTLTHRDKTREVGLHVTVVRDGGGWKVWSMGDRPAASVTSELAEPHPTTTTAVAVEANAAVMTAEVTSPMPGALWAGVAVVVLASLFGVALAVPAMMDRRGHR